MADTRPGGNRENEIDVVNAVLTRKGIIEKVVQEYIEEYTEENRQQDRRQEKADYQNRFRFLSLLLERYRQYPEGSKRKKYVDYLIKCHKAAYWPGITDEFYRVRHNLLVFRFILPQEREEKEICKMAGIKKSVYERNIKKGIEELMIHAFGVDGLPP